MHKDIQNEYYGGIKPTIRCGQWILRDDQYHFNHAFLITISFNPILIDTLTLRRSSLRYVMYLSWIQNVLQLPQHPGPLPASRLRVDEDEQRTGAIGRSDLEGDGGSPRFSLLFLLFSLFGGRSY